MASNDTKTVLDEANTKAVAMMLGKLEDTTSPRSMRRSASVGWGRSLISRLEL